MRKWAREVKALAENAEARTSKGRCRRYPHFSNYELLRYIQI